MGVSTSMYAVGLHVTADQADDGAALAEHVADLGVHDEVDVALAIADLAVGEAVELLGQRSQRLGEKRELGGGDGELPATGAQHAPSSIDDVPEVKLAEKPPALLAQVVHAAEELNLASDVLEDDEGNLALATERADAAGDGDHVLGVLTVGKACVVLLELRRVGRDLTRNGIGVHARIDERLAAGTALGPLVIRVVLARLGLIGHCCSSYSRAPIGAHVLSHAWPARWGGRGANHCTVAFWPLRWRGMRQRDETKGLSLCLIKRPLRRGAKVAWYETCLARDVHDCVALGLASGGGELNLIALAAADEGLAGGGLV